MSIGSTTMSFSSLTPYTHHPKTPPSPVLPGAGKDTGTKPVSDPVGTPGTGPVTGPVPNDFTAALQATMLRGQGAAVR